MEVIRQQFKERRREEEEGGKRDGLVLSSQQPLSTALQY